MSKPWGIGLNLGGGEILGIHAKWNVAQYQVRLHGGRSGSISASLRGDHKDGWVDPNDTLNALSHDIIFGCNVRYYYTTWAYAASGLAYNGRKILTPIYVDPSGEEHRATLHRTVFELPFLFGMEFARDFWISVYVEAGSVLQLNRAGRTEHLLNRGQVAQYTHPFGIPTLGLGVTFNFGG